MLCRISTVSCWNLARADAARIRTRRFGSRTASSRIGIARGCGIWLSAQSSRGGAQTRLRRAPGRREPESRPAAGRRQAPSPRRPLPRVADRPPESSFHRPSRKWRVRWPRARASSRDSPWNGAEKAADRLRAIHEAAHQRVRDGVSGNLQPADHEAFDDGLRRFGRPVRPRACTAAMRVSSCQSSSASASGRIASGTRMAPSASMARRRPIRARHTLFRCSDRASRSAEEFLQPGAVLVRRRANFLNHDRLHDFTLHGIVSPLLRGDFSPHDFAPLAVNLDRRACQIAVCENVATRGAQAGKETARRFLTRRPRG